MNYVSIIYVIYINHLGLQSCQFVATKEGDRYIIEGIEKHY